MKYGFSFDGRHSNDFGIVMKSESRPIIPSVDDRHITVPGRSGSILFPGALQDIEHTIKCAHIESSLEALREKSLRLADWLCTKERAILSFDDIPGKYYRGKVVGVVDPEQLATAQQFELTFRCEPHVYGAEMQKNFTDDAVTVYNQGTAETPPCFVATFSAAASEWKVVNYQGYYIRVARQFQAGDILEINGATGAVYVNGARAMDKLDWQYSKWFPLRPGENTLNVAPAGVCETKISWVPRWGA